MAAARKKQDVIAVPELDKGNHNNKKNLCDFLEQEAIAKKMIEEAQAFYKSFLKSKTVPFGKILEYPNTHIIRPCIKAYYRDIKVKGGIIGDLSPDKEILINVYFYLDLGQEYYSKMHEEWYNNLINDYSYYREDGEDKWRKRDFKNHKIASKLYADYSRFMYPDNMQDIKEDELTLACQKTFIYKVSDLIKYKELKSIFKDVDYIPWDSVRKIGLLSKHLSETGAKLFHGYMEQINYYRSRETEKDGTNIPELICIPEIKEFINEHQPALDAKAKVLCKNLIDNYKGTSFNFYEEPYIIQRNGDFINLLSCDIAKSSLDSKKGLYTVHTVDMEHSRAKYRWPSNAPLIVTTYHQIFVFDVATNDLVKYELEESSEEISRKYRY